MKKNQTLPNAKYNLIRLDLEKLEVNESICRKELRGRYYTIDGSWLDEFNENNFRVCLTNAKKLMPEKRFKTIHGHITRLK